MQGGIQAHRAASKVKLLFPVPLKSRSMRDNLLFSNIPEVQDESPIHTENILRQFLKNELKMDSSAVDHIRFERVHRIQGRSTPRMIFAK